MSKQIVIEKTDVGATLTTWIYCAFIQMYAAEQLGIENVYINWRSGFKPPRCLQAYEDKQKFSEIPNMYDWFFIQPKAGYHQNTTDAEIWTWEYDGDKMGGHHLMSQPLSVIKDYYKKNLIFNDTVNERGDKLVQKYGIDFSKTIGVGWRGGDIYLESLNGNKGRKYTPISYYYEWIDKALEQIPDARIACTAEEMEILDPLFKRYGERAFLIEEFYQVPKGSKHNPERVSPMSGFERGMQPALMVWLFSKCAWLIKNRASTTAVASWLSDGNIACINHSEVLGFPPHMDGVEYKGQLYPTTIN